MKSWVILLFISATMGGKMLMCNVDVQSKPRVMMSRVLLHYLMNGVNAGELLNFLKKCYPIVNGSIVLRERITRNLTAGSMEMRLIIILEYPKVTHCYVHVM